MRAVFKENTDIILKKNNRSSVIDNKICEK